MRNISKAAMTAAKIVEVLHWIGAICMAALLVCSLTAKDWLNGLLDSGVLEYNTGFFKTYGFEIGVSDGSGGLTMTAVAMFSVAGILLLSLMAMVFRNAYLIIKNSRGGTPFQEDNARMVKEIGIFYISMPIIGLTLSWISRLIIDVESAEISMDMGGFITGLLILCLTQVFSRGIKLEEDVEGLL